MRLVCISDTHCQLKKVKIPDGDLLIHSGDLTYRGTIEEVNKEARNLEKIAKKFTNGVLFIPGNHDRLAETNPSLFKDIMSSCKVLIHESIEINGIKFFGSPYTPFFHNWAFNIYRGNLKPFWDQIPENIQILITHGPLHGINDMNLEGENCGDKELLIRVSELKNLKYHIFGHIHEGYGTIVNNSTHFINASVCNRYYKPINQPIVIDI